MPSKPLLRPLHFGAIDGVAVGDCFESRYQLVQVGIHNSLQAGISGRSAEGCNAILVNPAYEDNLDLGDKIYYAGEGGRSRATGKQVAPQQLSGRNVAVYKSLQDRLPVRVVRQIATEAGPKYRYDGLYQVVDCEHLLGKSGVAILLFTFKLLIQPS